MIFKAEFTCLTYGSVNALRTTHPLISGQGFLHFLPFSKVECAEDTAELWKIIKNANDLAKNEEKTCPENYG